MLCFSVVGIAEGQEVGKLDITPFLKNTSVCSIVTNKADVLAGACYQAFSFRDWGSFNGGVLWDTNKAGDNESKPGVGGGAIAIGIRVDKAFGWAWSKAKMEERGAKLHFVVPQVEVGPAGGWHTRLGWFSGGFLNGKWPF